MGKQELKKLGVSGGMGPKATALFYDGVIDHTVAETDQEHIDMVILNKTDIPDRTEAIISGNGQEVIKALVDCAVVLEKLEVSAIATPCNTAHFYIKEIQDSVNVRIINMVESSVRYARERTELLTPGSARRVPSAFRVKSSTGNPPVKTRSTVA
jgi:aspartate racemase